MSDYDYILQTEADIYTNKKVNIKLEKIKYIAGSYSKNWRISNFKTLNKDFDKIKKYIGRVYTSRKNMWWN